MNSIVLEKTLFL